MHLPEVGRHIAPSSNRQFPPQRHLSNVFLFAFSSSPLFLFFPFFFPLLPLPLIVNKQHSRLPRIENLIGKCRSWSRACTVSLDDPRRTIHIKRSRLLLNDLVSSASIFSHTSLALARIIFLSVPLRSFTLLTGSSTTTRLFGGI